MFLLESFWRPLDLEDKASDTNRAGLSGFFPEPTFLVLGGMKPEALPSGSGTFPPSPHLWIKPLLAALNTEGLSEFQVWPCQVSHIPISRDLDLI